MYKISGDDASYNVGVLVASRFNISRTCKTCEIVDLIHTYIVATTGIFIQIPVVATTFFFRIYIFSVEIKWKS